MAEKLLFCLLALVALTHILAKPQPQEGNYQILDLVPDSVITEDTPIHDPLPIMTSLSRGKNVKGAYNGNGANNVKCVPVA